MAYTPTNWQNEGPPALNAQNLNKMEQGIKAAHDGVDAAAAHAMRTDNPHQVTRQQVGASQVAVRTGTVADGGTIPLPSGYSHSECWWMVSFNDQARMRDATRIRCFADPETRQVSVYAEVPQSDPDPPRRESGTANYIIIGVR